MLFNFFSNSSKNKKHLLFSFFILFLLVSLVFSSCSMKKMAVKAVSNALSGSGDSSAMFPLTGETDLVLMNDFFPTALKMYEIILSQDPEHAGMNEMTGMLYVMYANAFVQSPAELLPLEKFTEQNQEYIRAKYHYLKGFKFVLHGLDVLYPGFEESFYSEDASAFLSILSSVKKDNVSALYWCASGLLGAFSLEPLDTTVIKCVPNAVSMLEYGTKLDDGYGDGSIWSVLCAFYASAPVSMGGGTDKALAAYDKAAKYADGKSASLYNTYAVSFCIPNQDGDGFDKALNSSLSINPDDEPNSRLMTVLAQRKSKWLLEHKDDYIINWD